MCIAPGLRFKVRECSYSVSARSTGGFRADYGFVGTLDAEIKSDPDREIGYGITDFWVDPTEAIEEIPLTTLAKLSQRVTDVIGVAGHNSSAGGCVGSCHPESKHIDIKVRPHSFERQVKKAVLNCTIVMTTISLRNIFTKAILTRAFEFLLPRLGMKSMALETLKRLQDGEKE
ncbi:hypothetical protein Tco_0238595 [Tanacetum coccineum]